jgi:cysteinyl-tRNA synthetase
MDYSDDLIATATSALKSYHAFFDTAVSWLRRSQSIQHSRREFLSAELIQSARSSESRINSTTLLKFQANGRHIRRNSVESQLANEFDSLRVQVQSAILDDFDTPTVFRLLQQIVVICNAYFSDVAKSNSEGCAEVNIELVASIVQYIANILDLFGLSCFATFKNISNLAPLASQSTPDKLEHDVDSKLNSQLMLHEFLQFRSNVRSLALQLPKSSIEPSSSGVKKALLQACDEVRDKSMIESGVWVQDASNGKSEAHIIGPEQARARKQLMRPTSKQQPSK